MEFSYQERKGLSHTEEMKDGENLNSTFSVQCSAFNVQRYLNGPKFICAERLLSVVRTEPFDVAYGAREKESTQIPLL